MIPLAYLQDWSARAPWPDLRQVEQDLIISRALCDLYSAVDLKDRLAFRGGTAIHKLLLSVPRRYSEDIDLVQLNPEPIGPTITAIRNALSWLGRCKTSRTENATRLVFNYSSEADSAPMRLKIEINTREHASFYGTKRYPFKLASPWHQAEVSVLSFAPEEVFATKFRALLQRRKDRDLFDLSLGMTEMGLDDEAVLLCFDHYLRQESTYITRPIAEQRMLDKLRRSLREDVAGLLPAQIRYTDGDALRAWESTWSRLVQKLKGEPWKLSEEYIAHYQSAGLPVLKGRTAP